MSLIHRPSIKVFVGLSVGVILISALVMDRVFHASFSGWIAALLQGLILVSVTCYLAHIPEPYEKESLLNVHPHENLKWVAMASLVEAKNQCKAIAGDLKNFQVIMQNARLPLQNGFSEITICVNAQQALAAQMEETPAYKALGTNDFSSFIQQTKENLAKFVNYAVQNNGKGGEIVSSVGVAKNKVDAISRVLREIESISKQTNLLALNASVEAARAGERVQGFGVVADSVRDLSMNTNEFSQQIRIQITDVAEAIKQAESSVHAMANHDMSFALASRDQVDQALDQLAQMNKHIHDHVIQQADSAKNIEMRVEESTHVFEFFAGIDDLLTHMIHRLTLMVEVLTELTHSKSIVVSETDKTPRDTLPVLQTKIHTLLEMAAKSPMIASGQKKL